MTRHKLITTEDKKVSVLLNLPMDALQKLNLIAFQSSRNRSEILREAIGNFIEQNLRDVQTSSASDPQEEV